MRRNAKEPGDFSGNRLEMLKNYERIRPIFGGKFQKETPEIILNQENNVQIAQKLCEVIIKQAHGFDKWAVVC